MMDASIQIQSAGTRTPGQAFVSGGGVVRPAGVAVMPSGYRDVGEMLGDDIIRVGHRGLSADWSEGSLQGATAAMVAGVKAIEASVGLTSDGVPVILHDASIARTSHLDPATTPPLSAMTWGQVRAHGIHPPAAHPGRQVQPYLTLPEYAERIAPHVVTFIDPKLIPYDKWPLLFEIMDAAGGPARWVGKCAGPGGDWARALKRHHGDYLTWGYGYEKDAATADEWVTWCDTVAFDHNASDSAWAAVRTATGGRRLFAHIVETRAHTLRGLDMGATGLMVASTNALTE